MLGINRETGWNLVGGGTAALAGIAARSATKLGWKKLAHRDPPNNPASATVSWKEAIAWTVTTGVIVGLARLVARRGATSGWKKVEGRKPPLHRSLFA
jgi:hypothetical protein